MDQCIRVDPKRMRNSCTESPENLHSDEFHNQDQCECCVDPITNGEECQVPSELSTIAHSTLDLYNFLAWKGIDCKELCRERLYGCMDI